MLSVRLVKIFASGRHFSLATNNKNHPEHSRRVVLKKKVYLIIYLINN